MVVLPRRIVTRFSLTAGSKGLIVGFGTSHNAVQAIAVIRPSPKACFGIPHMVYRPYLVTALGPSEVYVELSCLFCAIPPHFPVSASPPL